MHARIMADVIHGDTDEKPPPEWIAVAYRGGHLAQRVSRTPRAAALLDRSVVADFAGEAELRGLRGASEFNRRRAPVEILEHPHTSR